MTAAPRSDFSEYLRSIVDRYEKWWEIDALTTKIAERQATFTFEQQVQTEEERTGESETQQGQNPRTIQLPLISGIQTYAKAEPVLVVGSPGVGKTSALLRCLVEYAEQELLKPEHDQRIPVLIRLKNYQKTLPTTDDPSGMLALIRNTLKPRLKRRIEITEVEDLLFQERLILLLDGFNELPLDESNYLRSFCEDFDQTPLICSTRELGSGALGITRKLVIQPPAPKEIDRFLDECIPAESRRKVEDLLNRDRRELSRTPFVLWMLYHVIQETGDVAGTLGEAFRQFFQSFKGRPEAAHVPEKHRQEWDAWLKHLAFTMFSSPDPVDPSLIISEKDSDIVLSQAFPAPHEPPSLRELLKYHLLQQENNKISFQHQLVQEYYAAEALVDRVESQLEDKKIPDDEFKHYYLNYLRWTEPIALMLSLLEEKNDREVLQIVQWALDIDLMLGARLAGAVRAGLQQRAINLLNKQILEVPNLLKIDLLCKTRSYFAISELIQLLQIALGLKPEINRDQGRAIRAIGEILGTEVLFRWFEALENPDDQAIGIWSEAVFCLDKEFLKNRLDENIILSLLNLLKQHKFPGIREISANILGSVEDRRICPDLLLALEDPAERVRLSATSALVKLNCQSAVPQLLKMLDDWKSNSRILESIAHALAVLDNDTAWNHPNTKVRQAAIAEFGNLGGQTVLPKLTEALEDHDFNIRAEAIATLTKIRGVEAIPKILEFLTDPTDWVRINVVWALGSLSEKEAIPHLYTCLANSDRQIRIVSLQQLQRIRPDLLVEKLREAMKSADLECCMDIFSALEDIYKHEILPGYIESLLFKDTPKYDEIITKIIDSVGQKKTSDLISKLQSQDFNTCWNATRDLAGLATQAVIPQLVLELKSHSLAVRRAVVERLSMLEYQDTVSGLIQALEDPDFEVRKLAVFGLSSKGASEHLQQLWDLQKAEPNMLITFSIDSIQRRCKFYNYKVYERSQKNINLKQCSEAIEAYNKALKIIFDVGKEIERKPGTYSTMGEEDLRDVFLLGLNSSYSGQATGETFNKKGKTDILLRVNNENVFIGECKFWGGKKKLKETLDQLLGYATWHDDQLALLFFNRNKNFSAVRDQIPEGIKGHPCFIREEKHPIIDFFYIVQHPDDCKRELKLAVLAFDIPS